MASLEVDGFGTEVIGAGPGGRVRPVEAMVTRKCLEEFYHCLKGGQWRNQKNWNTPYDIFGWEGTVWDKSVDPPQLIGLDLANNNLEGKIPASIGKLKSLEFLALSQNSIMGGGNALCPYCICEEMARLPKLGRIEMQHNEMAGPLPPNIGDCKQLTVLRLEHNFISGGLPRTIGHCVRLRFVALSFNRLTEPLPDMLAQCKNLEVLWLDHNNIRGTIGQRYKNLKALQLINLSHNSLDEEALAVFEPFMCAEIPALRFYSYPQEKKRKKKGDGRADDAAQQYNNMLGSSGVTRPG